MSLIGWLALGVIAGLIANRLTEGRRSSWALDSALGVAGAVGGGFMFWNFGGGSISGVNAYSLVVALISAVAALLTYHALSVYPGDGAE